MKIDEVLTIDVEAELREVCREQLQGDWQIPAEVVRFAVRRGAAEVSVARRRRGFAVRATGVVCRDGELHHAAVALDPARPAEARHRSIAALERVGGNVLLWAGGAEGARLRVGNRVAGAATVLRVRPGRTPEIEENAIDELPGGFELAFAAPGFDARQSLAWLATACRFAPVAITVAGRPLPQGFGPSLRSVSLGRPVPGGIALSAAGDAPHLWLLRHGVLASRATVPGYPPFEAVLELGEITAEGAGQDELRRAAQPLLPALLERVGDMILEAVGQARLDDAGTVSRLCTVGLRAIRSGVARERLLEAALIPAFAPADGASTRLSVAELKRRCDGRRAPLLSVPSRPARRRLGGTGGAVLLLDPEQHRLLADLLPVRIERPEPRRRRMAWRSLAAGLSSAAGRIRVGLSSLLGASVLPESELIDVERDLLRRLSGAVVDDAGRPLRVRMIAGIGPVRRGRGAMLIPRHNPLVARGVRLVAADEAWLYPVALALAGGERRVAPDPALRRAWLATQHGASVAVGEARRETNVLADPKV